MERSRLVYSSDSGRIASPPPSKGGNKQTKAAKPAAYVPNDGGIRISRETAHRGGKTVTVIRGLPANELESRAAELKRLCGAGGTLRDGAIEIQGDHRDKIVARLREAGYTVKLA